jgi:hypothetical protein
MTHATPTRPLPRLRTRACALAAALALASAACAAAPAASWPSVALPAGAVPFQVGEQLSVGGFPMRLQGFVTHTAPLETEAWFRNSLGQPLVEDIVQGKLVLGQARGDYYVTVMLEALPEGRAGTRGTVTVSNVKAAYERRDATRATNERMLARLPYGSRLVSQLASTERGKATSYVMAENGHSLQLNRDHVVERLQAEGYALEREARPDPARVPALPATLAAGRTLFFKGKNKEAMAVIRPAAKEGYTSIVIQTINLVEAIK